VNSCKYYDLIRKPLITEKATMLAEVNKYTFSVRRDANKSDIRQAVEYVFAVKVDSVCVANVKGKVKRFKGKLGTRAAMKKAIVTLSPGHTIDFSGVK
jgi:large subunit ribosomal protein L23